MSFETYKELLARLDSEADDATLALVRAARATHAEHGDEALGRALAAYDEAQERYEDALLSRCKED